MTFFLDINMCSGLLIQILTVSFESYAASLFLHLCFGRCGDVDEIINIKLGLKEV